MKCKLTLWCGIVLGLAVLVAAGGCTKNRRSAIYLNEQADLKFYQRVGLVPFTNYSTDKLAGEKMTECFLTELLKLRQFDVVSPGTFNTSLAKVLNGRGAAGDFTLNPDQLKALAETTGVQGIVEGSVQEFGLVRVGQDMYPLVAMTVRLVDVNTGTIVWQANFSEQGGPRLPVVSVGETFSLGMMALKASQTLADKLRSKIF